METISHLPNIVYMHPSHVIAHSDLRASASPRHPVEGGGAVHHSARRRHLYHIEFIHNFRLGLDSQLSGHQVG